MHFSHKISAHDDTNIHCRVAAFTFDKPNCRSAVNVPVRGLQILYHATQNIAGHVLNHFAYRNNVWATCVINASFFFQGAWCGLRLMLAFLSFRHVQNRVVLLLASSTLGADFADWLLVCGGDRVCSSDDAAANLHGRNQQVGTCITVHCHVLAVSVSVVVSSPALVRPLMYVFPHGM